MKRVAVIQSSYLPWKGFFDIVHDVDLFVFYDDVLYSRDTWRNRNIVKTPQGAAWLTIPVGSAKGRQICDVELPGGDWAARHWKTLQHCYARAPYFTEYRDFFEGVYRGRWTHLSQLNQYLITIIAREFLGIRTELIDSRTIPTSGTKQDRLLSLLAGVGATHYLSGAAAQAYIDPAAFERAGIELQYKDYSGYPEYPQLNLPFVHAVSIVDLLFQTGKDAPEYIWGWRSKHGR